MLRAKVNNTTNIAKNTPAAIKEKINARFNPHRFRVRMKIPVTRMIAINRNIAEYGTLLVGLLQDMGCG